MSEVVAFPSPYREKYQTQSKSKTNPVTAEAVKPKVANRLRKAGRIAVAMLYADLALVHALPHQSDVPSKIAQYHQLYPGLTADTSNVLGKNMDVLFEKPLLDQYENCKIQPIPEEAKDYVTTGFDDCLFGLNQTGQGQPSRLDRKNMPAPVYPDVFVEHVLPIAYLQDLGYSLDLRHLPQTIRAIVDTMHGKVPHMAELSYSSLIFATDKNNNIVYVTLTVHPEIENKYIDKYGYDVRLNVFASMFQAITGEDIENPENQIKIDKIFRDALNCGFHSDSQSGYAASEQFNGYGVIVGRTAEGDTIPILGLKVPLTGDCHVRFESNSAIAEATHPTDLPGISYITVFKRPGRRY